MNRTAAEQFDVGVGDVLPLAFWARADDLEGDAGRLSVADEGDDRIVQPVGVEHPRVVGVGNLPDEVLPDDLYDRHRLLVSPDIADRYDCLPEPVSAEMARPSSSPPRRRRDAPRRTGTTHSRSRAARRGSARRSTCSTGGRRS